MVIWEVVRGKGWAVPRHRKTEQVHHRMYHSRAEARRDIFGYIEVFYNRVRLHSTLGYLSSAQFESHALARAA